MPQIKLDAVAVTSRDMARSAQFYSRLGFRFPQMSDGEKHLEAITPKGEVRLMIDERGLIKSIIGADPTPSNHSAFALKCATPADVDAAVADVRAGGFHVVKEPWDAFWGQRYAIVADPDGYMVDLFAFL